MTESQLQKQIIFDCKQMGMYVVKVVSATRDGIPDLLICHKGIFIAIEVKTDIGRISPLQEHNITKIQDAGGQAYIVKGKTAWIGLKEKLAKL